jgi:hypothetical protein
VRQVEDYIPTEADIEIEIGRPEWSGAAGYSM